MKHFTTIKTWLKNRNTQAEALCPLPGRLDLASLQRVQVFVPHPDDESIGCGGLLALLAQRGCDVQVVLVTDGSGAGGLPPGAAQERWCEFVAALDVLGISNYLALDFPDGAVRPGDALNQSLDQAVTRFSPDSIIMPSMLDLHRDHRVIAAALLNLPLTGVLQLIQYEVWCPLPATHLVDITAVAEQKWRAIAQHKTALACGDYLAASEGLSRYRGLLLGVRGHWAEAYVLVAAPKAKHDQWLAKIARELLLRLN